MTWITEDVLVGQTVEISTCYGETELAVVLAVSDRNAQIKVRAVEDGEILIGGQWEQIDEPVTLERILK